MTSNYTVPLGTSIQLAILSAGAASYGSVFPAYVLGAISTSILFGVLIREYVVQTPSDIDS